MSVAPIARQTRVAGPSPNMAQISSSTSTRRTNVAESKSRRTSIRRPPVSTTSSPQGVRFVPSRSFLAISTATNRLLGASPWLKRRFLTWRRNALMAKLCRRQNSLWPSPLASNSSTNRLISSLLRRFRLGISWFSVIPTLQQISCANGRWGWSGAYVPSATIIGRYPWKLTQRPQSWIDEAMVCTGQPPASWIRRVALPPNANRKNRVPSAAESLKTAASTGVEVA
jgi:hypothetical protein